MSDEAELLPCPFCGGKAVLRHEDDAWTPECLMEKQCPDREHRYIDFPWYWEKADAVKAWNTRHPAPLVWSSERPKVAGDYVVLRRDGGLLAWTYQPGVNELTFSKFAEKGWLWIGPVVFTTPSVPAPS